MKKAIQIDILLIIIKSFKIRSYFSKVRVCEGTCTLLLAASKSGNVNLWRIFFLALEF